MKRKDFLKSLIIAPVVVSEVLNKPKVLTSKEYLAGLGMNLVVEEVHELFEGEPYIYDPMAIGRVHFNAQIQDKNGNYVDFPNDIYKTTNNS